MDAGVAKRIVGRVVRKVRKRGELNLVQAQRENAVRRRMLVAVGQKDGDERIDLLHIRHFNVRLQVGVRVRVRIVHVLIAEHARRRVAARQGGRRQCASADRARGQSGARVRGGARSDSGAEMRVLANKHGGRQTLGLGDHVVQFLGVDSNQRDAHAVRRLRAARIQLLDELCAARRGP